MSAFGEYIRMRRRVEQQTPTPAPVGPTHYQTLETRDVLPKELLDGATKVKTEDVNGIVLKCVKDARKVRNAQPTTAGILTASSLDPAYTFAIHAGGTAASPSYIR